jgi:hypothetical protein
MNNRRNSYIIDFELCSWDDGAEWNDNWYFLWGLALTLGEDREKW